METMIDMSDADLLARLCNFEDQFVERKTVADLNDALKTVVAFANSAPLGMPCVLYIGVRDDGQFEDRQHDYDFCAENAESFAAEDLSTRCLSP